MENLETGKDKIRQICEILKNESLEPAKLESQRMKEQAEQDARTILRKAEEESRSLIEQAKLRIAKEKEIFDNAIQAACRQAMETLRQEIETALFNPELNSWLKTQTQDPQVVAKFVNTLVSAIEKEGISADFSALIPKEVPSNKVNALLLTQVLEKLKEHSVTVGDFDGGIQVKLHDKRIILDLSNDALKELLGRYLRKDFRDILFSVQ